MNILTCAAGVCLAAVLNATAAERFVCAGEQASLSPDGRRLVFQRLEDGRFGVYVRDCAKGGEIRLSPPGVDAIQPEWGEDGRIVWSEGRETKTAFTAQHDETGWNLVEMDASSERRTLTAGRHRLFSPTYGPDGRVYFSSEIVKPDGGSTDTFAGNRTGLGVLTGETNTWYRRVTVFKVGNAGIADAHFSASEMIRSEVAGYLEPWRIVISPIGKPDERTYLTGKDMVAVSPAISRDGRCAAFAGCREGDDGWRIYAGELKGTNGVFRKIAAGGNPSFSPDGRQVVYDREGRIYAIEADAPAMVETPHRVGRHDRRPEVLDHRVAAGSPADSFEKIALVDGSDFATVFDVETRAGVRRTLEHVARTGADTMLWRTHSGAMPRYRSDCENPYRLDHPVDTRRMVNCSTIHSWMKLWRGGEDPLTWAFDECAGIPSFREKGFHTLEEEAHWQFQYLGEWNLNHPQFACRKADGTVQMYHSSFAYPEVIEHRLDIVRELLKRKPDALYYDTMRNGGYMPSADFVKPNVEEWHRRFPDKAVPGGARDAGWSDWVALCGESQYRYLAGVMRLIDEAGLKTRLIVNVEGLEADGNTWTKSAQGIDWRELLRRNLADAIAVTSIRADPLAPLASVERSVLDFMREVGGRCKVYMPILNYNFSERRPSYWQLAQWADVDEAAMVRQLLALYDRSGAAGVVMECVDYGNYSDAVCKVISGYRRGDAKRIAPIAEQPTAEVRSLKMHSASMRKDLPVTVLLPSGYAHGDRHYPVVYMLHGAGNDERTYAVRPIRNLAEKYGMIVVAPYGGATWWMDAPEVPHWKYETMITRELVPWVDANFRTLARREGRMIAGHSMGGQGACRIGFRHRDVFSKVGNVMGGVDIASVPERADLQRILGKYADHPQRWRDYSVIAEASKLRQGDIALITVVGDRDFFLQPNRHLHALLASNGVTHAYIERPGEHTRAFAYQAMKDVFGFFAEDAAGRHGSRTESDGFEMQRAEMLSRPRPVIWNTDGNDMQLYPKAMPIDEASFESVRLKWTEGTRISTVFYCPQSSGFGYFNAMRAGDFKTVQVQPDNPKAYNAASDFAAKGLDALQMATDYCRRRGLEIFVSIRFNDTHDNAGMQKPGAISPHWSPFKAAHPECLMGTVTNRPRYCSWTAVDFAQPAVRDYAKRFMRQFFENYDIDGVEYDFFRHLQLFKTVASGEDATADELDLMTTLMRDLRKIADEVGRRRGRPFLVAVRVPDSPGFCRAVGIDLERWMNEKLVDMVVGSGYFQLNPWRQTADWVHAHGCKFYASLDEPRNQPKRAPIGMLPGRGISRSFYLPRFRAALEGGADGVYIFNVEQKKLRTIASIDPDTRADCPRCYFAVPRATALAQFRHYCRNPERFYNLPPIEPQNPKPLGGGESVAFELFLGKEPLEDSGLQCEATVLTDRPDGLRLRVNGTSCERQFAADREATFRVPPACLRSGSNRIEIGSASDCRLADFCLIFK